MQIRGIIVALLPLFSFAPACKEESSRAAAAPEASLFEGGCFRFSVRPGYKAHQASTILTIISPSPKIPMIVVQVIPQPTLTLPELIRRQTLTMRMRRGAEILADRPWKVDGVPGHRFVSGDPQEYNDFAFVVREGRGIVFGVNGRDLAKALAPGHLKEFLQTVRWTACR